VSPTARLAPLGLAAVIAATVGSLTTALAFDKVDHLKPIQAGRGYVFFVKEVDTNQQPLGGRRVTADVGRVPGAGASVAPCDAQGHATGPAAESASAQSGDDGHVYFLLRTSSTPGENEFTWTDATWTGEVLVTGEAPASALAGAASGGGSGGANGAGGVGGVGAAGAAGGPGGTGGGAPSAAALAGRLPARGVPPLAAALAAAGLVWLVLPGVLAGRRREALMPMPDLATRLPRAIAPPR